MILAAGLGTRLRPMTENLAKPAIPVVNVPLILYNLQLLKQAGVREVMVNLHYLPETIKRIMRGGRKLKMKIHYSLEPEILGTGGGLKKAEAFFNDEPFILINGDIIVAADLEKAVRFHHDRDALATMVLRSDKNAEKYGIIGLDEERRIRRFTEHVVPPPSLKKLSRYMFTGIHILSPGVFEYLPPAIEVCINKYAYPRMILNNEPVFGFVSEGYWSDLGTVESYFQASMTILKSPQILPYFDPLSLYEYAPKREVERVIRVGKNVNLRDGVQLIDPVVIGDGGEIEEGSVVGPNVIVGPECVIAKNSRIEDSILWPGVKVAENTLLSFDILTRAHRISLGPNGKAVTSVSSLSG